MECAVFRPEILVQDGVTRPMQALLRLIWMLTLLDWTWVGCVRDIHNTRKRERFAESPVPRDSIHPRAGSTKVHALRAQKI